MTAAHNSVVDLMAALEKSLDDAKRAAAEGAATGSSAATPTK